MSEPATEWISPWYARWHGLGGAFVRLTNPNKVKAEVTLNWYTFNGVLALSWTEEIEPSHIEGFYPYGEYGTFWLHIKSDQVIVPWGLSHSEIVNHPDWPNQLHPMTFFRADEVKPARNVLVEWDDLPVELRPSVSPEDAARERAMRQRGE